MSGATALMHAAASRAGYVEAVRVLVEAGASLQLVDEDGDTALRWAEQIGKHEGVIACILRYGGLAK